MRDIGSLFLAYGGWDRGWTVLVLKSSACGSLGGHKAL